MAMGKEDAELLKMALGEDSDITIEELMEDTDIYDIRQLADEVISEEIIDQGRWMTHYRTVVRFKGVFLALYDSRGSTEMQDDYDDIEIKRVYPKSVTTIIYE